MKRKSLILTAILAFSFSFMSTRAEACTNIIVTQGASADGSALVSYAADSHWLFGELYFHPAQDWKPGSMLKVYEWDSHRYLGEIPQVAHTYKTVGNMNEHQLIIAETTFGGRPELADDTGIMDYGSLIYIGLQRARTAREAIDVIVNLANEYGYASSGETFTLADKNEVWIMEMMPKGKLMKDGKNTRKGMVWVARRVPDGYVCAHANQSRITTFPQNDPENCIFSEDVISFAREMGYYEGPDSEFSFRDAYCPVDFGSLRGCEGRVWSAFNIAGAGKFVFPDESGNMVSKESYDYIDFAMGYNKENSMPLWIKPSKKLSVKDVADMMRDHYENTPMDMRTDIGAGGNALPYRWRPMDFEYGDKTYVNERAIATQQTGFWFVGQARPQFPDVIGGIIWFGTDDAATSYVTPIYTNTNEVPECFRQGNGDLLNYSETASFWLNNRVANACYKMYNYMEAFVRERIDQFENSQLESIKAIDRKAMDLYESKVTKLEYKARKKQIPYDPTADTGKAFDKIKELLTEYSVSTAQNQFAAWKNLEQVLLVKFIDGNVKAQDKDGNFLHSEHSKGIPEGLTQPGYTNFWKDAVVHYQGEILEVVEDKK